MKLSAVRFCVLTLAITVMFVQILPFAYASSGRILAGIEEPADPEGREIDAPSPGVPEGRMADGAGPEAVNYVGKGILPAEGRNCGDILTLQPELFDSKDAFLAFPANEKSNVLACAIKTGRIRFYMMPFFIVYLIEFLVGLAGIISVLFIVVGGYKYIIGGISDDTESGKKTIMYAIIGLVVSLSAWIIINVIQYQVTL